MVVGILQFQVLVHGAESLKDKRRVVQSLKDRLHREHLCAIAEVGDPDLLNQATVALAIVSRDGKRAGEILDAITAKLRELRDGQVGEIYRQILHGSGGWLPGELPDPEKTRHEPEATPEAAAGHPPVSASIPDPKSGDRSDESIDAMILERALDSDILDQIARAEAEIRRTLKEGDAA